MHIALGRTWEYVAGNKVSCPTKSDSGYETWVKENCNAHRRIWLALEDDTKQAVLPYADSHASQLFTVLKSLYKPQGTTAEFYAQHAYENIKLSEHNSFNTFMTTLINAAHQFNKEITNINSHIKNRDIAMRIIHALPTPLFSLQTILLKNAPLSNKTDWDLQALRQCITSAEDWA